MFLLAETTPAPIDQVSGGTWVMVVGAVLTSVSALAAALFAWLTQRDKLKYDARMVKLQADIEALQKAEREWTEALKECEERSAKMERDFKQEIQELREQLFEYVRTDAKKPRRRASDDDMHKE